MTYIRSALVVSVTCLWLVLLVKELVSQVACHLRWSANHPPMSFNKLNVVELSRFAEQFFAGSPIFAYPVLFNKGDRLIMGQITVKDSDAPLGATVTFLDAKGATTTPDSVPTWASSDETVATVQVSDDGLSAVVTIGNPGATVISVDTTDNDGTVVHSE